MLYRVLGWIVGFPLYLIGKLTNNYVVAALIFILVVRLLYLIFQAFSVNAKNRATKTVKAAVRIAAFHFTGYPRTDKPQGFGDRVPITFQAANLSSKYITNCAYASPQSLTGIVHFFEISIALI